MPGIDAVQLFEFCLGRDPETSFSCILIGEVDEQQAALLEEARQQAPGQGAAAVHHRYAGILVPGFRCFSGGTDSPARNRISP